MADRVVVIPLFAGMQPVDMVGPHEVLAGANEAMDRLGRQGRRYRLITAALAAGPVKAESGLVLCADVALADVKATARNPVHTLLIPGGDGVHERPLELIDHIARLGSKAERVATVCSGAFLAAAAGLCDGRRVTTHWSVAGQLADMHPNLTVDPDPIYIHDGPLWTSAGVTSGIDLALALVEHDCGSEIARIVARYMVVYLQRPGGQSQFAAPVWSKAAEGAPIRQACDIIHAELSGDLSVDTLASRVGLSPRHFTRKFRSEIGEPVGKHVERLRVEAARQVLETEQVGLDAVAKRCGFGSAETLRRAFHRRLGCSPNDYRRQFATARG